MTFFGNWLDHRIQPRAGQQRRFVDWRDAPLIKPVPAGRLGLLTSLGLPTRPERQGGKYGPAIVIGLGATGEHVLRQWLAQMAQVPEGRQEMLRALLITPKPVPPLPAEALPVWQFDLASSGDTIIAGGSHSRRKAMHSSFRQAANYGPFQTYLRNCREELSNALAIVVASLAESSIGLLGDVLQTLRLLSESVERSNFLLNISVLLTLETPDPASALDYDEIYAALREIGRFTFIGPHQMEAPPGFNDGIVRTSLLDYLFVIEARNLSPLALDLRNTPFDEGVGQALAELLFVLLQPASGPSIRDLLNKVGQAHGQTHETVVHSLGIATLEVPLGELQSYVAARLAYAAFYGERSDRRTEGLLSRNESAADYAQFGRLITDRWLREGPCAHPLFEWLLEANGSDYFRVIPSLSREFEETFQAQLAHGLTALLNNPAEEDQLAQARAALDCLGQHFEKVEGWFKAAPAPDPNATERLVFQALLHRWCDALRSLKQQVEAWEHVLLPTGRTTSARASEKSTMAAASRPNWRQASPTPSAEWRALTSSPSATASSDLTTVPTSLPDFLLKQRQLAEAALTAAAGSQIRCALTADCRKGLEEAELYYKDTVRPELSRYGLPNSLAFTRLRDRLGWWIELVPGRLPELFLICMPAEIAGSGADAPPPPEARFGPPEIEALGEAVLQLAQVQAQGLTNDLTGRWFRQRLARMADFLQRAQEPFLAYDQDAVVARPNVAAHQPAYLIARDKTLTGDYKTIAFPNVAHRDINEVGGGEATRLTALAFRLNIPIRAIRTIQQMYQEYQRNPTEHLYQQEATARIYERRIWSVVSERILLPPDLTVALADPQLVTLFCQAVFCKLITVRRDEFGQNPTWTVASVGEQFPPLPLVSAVTDGLWHALRRFALELPNDPEVDRNPTNHFCSLNRKEYIAELTKAVKDHAVRPEARAYREEFKKTILAEWQRRGEQDLLAKSFALVLNAELDEPVWKGW